MKAHYFQAIIYQRSRIVKTITFGNITLLAEFVVKYDPFIEHEFKSTPAARIDFLRKQVCGESSIIETVKVIDIIKLFDGINK